MRARRNSTWARGALAALLVLPSLAGCAAGALGDSCSSSDDCLSPLICVGADDEDDGACEDPLVGDGAFDQLEVVDDFGEP